jgi:hypothetical protein
LPTDLDLDGPVAFWMLFFTDEIIQHLMDCTNCQAERERGRERGNARPWRPIDQVDMGIYLGTLLLSSLLSIINSYLGSPIWMDCHSEHVLGYYLDTSRRSPKHDVISTAISKT